MKLPEQHIDKSYAGGGIRNQNSKWSSGSAFDRMHKGFDSGKVEENKKPYYLDLKNRPPNYRSHSNKRFCSK